MKKSIFIVLCCFIIATFTAHADSGIHISILGPSSTDDIRFLYLESLEAESGIAKYAISYHGVDISTDDMTLLMSGNYDIALVYQKVLQEGAKQGLVLSLTDISSASQIDWIPLSSLLKSGGTQYGLPFCYLSNLLSLNNNVAQHANFHLPQAPYSWGDLVQACNASSISQSDDVCFMYANVQLPFFMMQYMSSQYASTEDLSFDTPTFRKAMIAYADMVRSGYIIDYEHEAHKTPIFTLTPYPVHYVPFPDLGSESCFVVDLYALCIPRNAKNTDGALAFLSDYASLDCQERIPLGSWSQMICQDPGIYAQGMIDYFPFYSESLRQEIISRGVPRFPNEEFIQYLNQTGIISSYIDQEITLDQLLIELQETWEHIMSKQE